MNANIPTCLALVLALAPVAAGGQRQEELQALDGHLLQALLDGDAEAIGQLISPEFGYYRAFENRPMRGLDAEQWQRAVLGENRLESFEIHESYALRIGDQVVQTATRATILTRAGRESGDGGRQRLLTSTWLEDQDGAWRIVTRLDVELGTGPGRKMDREAWRERSGDRLRHQPAAEGTTDLEAWRDAWRERSGDRSRHQPAAEGTTDLEAWREAWRERSGGGRSLFEPAAEEAPAEEAPAEEPPAEEPPAEEPPPAGG